MNLPSLRFALPFAFLLPLACGGPAPSLAADTTLHFVVGFPAGGGLDTMTRLIAERVRVASGRPVIVENRPGGGGRIAAEAISRAEGDGNTLFAAPIVTTAFFPFVYKNLTFDPLTDLTPVTRFTTFQFALAVNRDLPVRDVREFIAYLKANPGKTSFGSLSAGTPSHFLGEMFNRATGTDMVHVPYRGSAPALTDLQGGQIQAAFDTTASVMQLYKADRVRVLAVTGTRRSALLPDVPTFAELKLGLGDMETAELWYGFFAPGKTPAPLVAQLNAMIVEALKDPQLVSKLEALDVRVVSDTPEQFKRIIASDYERWGKLIRATGFTASE